MATVLKAGTVLITRSALEDTLREIGVQEGDVLCVHCGIGQLGYVHGGSQTVIEALRNVLGDRGTLMMPVYTRDCADPAEWQYPPAPPHLIPTLRENAPAYDPVRTPSVNMGRVAELFRTYPGVIRSHHPISSVAVQGDRANDLIEQIKLDWRFGPNSAYGRLVELNGKVLLLGAAYNKMSLLHLTQYTIKNSSVVEKRAKWLTGRGPEWVSFKDYLFPHGWSTACVEAMRDTKLATEVPCGSGYAFLVDAAEAVDFAVAWRQEMKQ